MGMGREPRSFLKGVIAHVTSRGNDGQDIFLDSVDRVMFLAILSDVCRKAGASVLTYCLMGNHFHLLIEVGDVTLSRIMQRLLTRYVRYFNRRHGRRGHLFEERFLSKVCTDQGYLATLLRYIHRNPVKDGFVSGPGDWPWSTHHQIIGRLHSTLLALDRLFALLASTAEEARAAFDSIMAGPDDAAEVEFDEFEVRGPWGDGSKRPPLEALAAVTFQETGWDVAMKPGGRRPRGLSQARLSFICEAERAGHPTTAIALFLGLTPGGVAAAVRRSGGIV